MQNACWFIWRDQRSQSKHAAGFQKCGSNRKMPKCLVITLIFPEKLERNHVADLKSPHFWSQPDPNKLKLQKALSKISQIFCWDQLIFWVCAAILTASLALTNVLVNAATSTRHRDNWSCTRRRRCLLVSMWPAVAKAKSQTESACQIFTARYQHLITLRGVPHEITTPFQKQFQRLAFHLLYRSFKLSHLFVQAQNVLQRHQCKHWWIQKPLTT